MVSEPCTCARPTRAIVLPLVTDNVDAVELFEVNEAVAALVTESSALASRLPVKEVVVALALERMDCACA